MRKLLLGLIAIGLSAVPAFADRGRSSSHGGFSYDRGSRYEHSSGRSNVSFGLSLGFGSRGYRDYSYGSISIGSGRPYYRDSYCSTPTYYRPTYYYAPTYCPPVYRETVYAAPVYREPVYREPVYRESAYVAPAPVTYYDRPTITSNVYVEPTYSTYSAPSYYRQAPCATYSYRSYDCAPTYYRPAPVYGGSSVQLRATYYYRR